MNDASNIKNARAAADGARALLEASKVATPTVVVVLGDEFSEGIEAQLAELETGASAAEAAAETADSLKASQTDEGRAAELAKAYAERDKAQVKITQLLAPTRGIEQRIAGMVARAQQAIPAPLQLEAEEQTEKLLGVYMNDGASRAATVAYNQGRRVNPSTASRQLHLALWLAGEAKALELAAEQIEAFNAEWFRNNPSKINGAPPRSVDEFVEVLRDRRRVAAGKGAPPSVIHHNEPERERAVRTV